MYTVPKWNSVNDGPTINVQFPVSLGNGVSTLFCKHSMIWVRICDTSNRASIGEFPPPAISAA